MIIKTPVAKPKKNLIVLDVSISIIFKIKDIENKIVTTILNFNDDFFLKNKFIKQEIIIAK
jgi:hypothetical protein